MRFALLSIALLTLAGCAAPPARYQIVSVPQVVGFDKPGGSMLLDTQTGQTWTQDFQAFPRGNGNYFHVLFWREMSRNRPTTLPELEK